MNPHAVVERIVRDAPEFAQAGADRAGDPPAARVLTEVDLADLANVEPPDRRFWIQGILPERSVTLLGAHGGAGKSTIALTMACHLAAGRAWAGLEVARARVLFLSLEDDGAIIRYRLRRICEAHALQMDEVAEQLQVLDGSDAGALMFERMEMGDRRLVDTAAMGNLRELVTDIDVLMVDNASDALDANENDRRAVRTFVRRLGVLVKERSGAVLLLAHTPKAKGFSEDSESYSGSTAWHNSARSRLALIAIKASDQVRLEQQKSNFGRRIEPLHFTWSEHGVLVPTEAPAQPAAPVESQDDREVLRAIEDAERRGVRVPTASNGARTASAVLDALVAFKAANRRQRIRAALNRLELDGKIERVYLPGADRKEREYFTVAGNAGNAGNAE